MKCSINTEINKSSAKQSPALIQEAHNVLERMNTGLTLSQAKTALVKQLVLRKKSQELHPQALALSQPKTNCCCR